jgi:membrane protein
MLVSLIVNAVVDLLQDHLQRYFDTLTVYIFWGVNYVVLYLIITLLFAIIFKVLPDAKIRTRDALTGASFTAVLFLVGKFLIGYYLSHSSIGVTYGTAASIMLLLVWVYYTSVILFYGAEFTKVYTLNLGSGIEPDKTAVFILKREAKELDYEKIEQ